MLTLPAALGFHESTFAGERTSPLKECNKTLYMKQFFLSFIKPAAHLPVCG
jgi:hypothetical protein